MTTLKTHIEAEQHIEYDYEPPCPETNHHESISIGSVTLYGIELLPALSRNAIDKLEELCMDDVVNRHEETRY